MLYVGTTHKAVDIFKRKYILLKVEKIQADTALRNNLG